MYSLHMDKEEELQALTTHDLETEQGKQKLFNYQCMKELAETMLFTLQTSPINEDVSNRIQTTKAHIDSLKDLIHKEEVKQKNISLLKADFKEKLNLPDFGILDNFDVEKCRLYCPTFSDTSGTTSLETFWKKLCCFAEQEQLSEKGVKQVLSCLLQGSAYETYYFIKERSIKEILQTLIDRFGLISTLSDKLQALETIKREEGEKLKSVMARVSQLIDQTQHVVSYEQRKTRHELLMMSNLKNLCNQKAKLAIAEHAATAARAGYTLPFISLYHIALDVERDAPELITNVI